MSSSGYDIRQSILSAARELLTGEWQTQMEVEHRTAEFEKRAPKFLPAPTVDAIKAAAESMYEFVQKK